MGKIEKNIKAREITVSIYSTPITDEIGAGETGKWRTLTPQWQSELCEPCGTCVKYCPDGVVKFKSKKIVFDYVHCKGCGVCASECPTDAIVMIEEKEEG